MLYTDSHGSKENFAKDPAVIRLGDTYYLYHSSFIAGKNPGDKDRLIVAIAASDDMEHWNFVDFLPLTQECEERGIGAPAAYVEDGVVHLFYQTYGNREKDAICHATSRDGIHFTKDPTNPIFRPTADWCCGRAIDADVVAFGASSSFILPPVTRISRSRCRAVPTRPSARIIPVISGRRP